MPASNTTGVFTVTDVYDRAINDMWVTGAYNALSPTLQFLVVAGGGGGGNGGGSAYESGGGGAGGLIYHPTFSLSAGTYTITVGGGGTYNTNGANSTVSYNSSNVLTAMGGAWSTNNGSAGQIGGSGGGGTHNGSAGGAGVQTTNQSISADSRTYGFGTNGGNGATSAGGGGGGAGAAGTNATNANAGTGGIGKQYDISGTSLYYAGGGGGGVTAAAGGLGGGGTGSAGSPGGNGTNNLGGGGGGAAGSGASVGGSGGSGVVILRYLDTFPTAISTTGSPNVIVSGGYRSYRFWQSGSITF